MVYSLNNPFDLGRKGASNGRRHWKERRFQLKDRKKGMEEGRKCLRWTELFNNKSTALRTWRTTLNCMRMKTKEAKEESVVRGEGIENAERRREEKRSVRYVVLSFVFESQPDPRTFITSSLSEPAEMVIFFFFFFLASFFFFFFFFWLFLLFPHTMSVFRFILFLSTLLLFNVPPASASFGALSVLGSLGSLGSLLRPSISASATIDTRSEIIIKNLG